MINKLHLILLLILSGGCALVDPNIPEGFTSYEEGEVPVGQLSVGELTSQNVQLHVQLDRIGNRRLTELRLCYSETKLMPDTTDCVQDVFVQYEEGKTSFMLYLSDLDPATQYRCRLYLANRDQGGYSQPISFSTKVASNDTSWQRVASIPFEGEYRNGFAFGERYFALSSLSTSYLLEYLPHENQWIKRSELPFGKRVSPISVVADGKGYAGMGDLEQITAEGHHVYNFQCDWWCYEPQSDTWEQRASIPTSTTGMMASFAVEQKIYVITSPDYWNTTPMQVWEYDTQTDQWNRKQDFPGDKLQHACSFVINGRPFIFTGTTNRMIQGGHVEDNVLEYVSSVWEYEPRSDTWYMRRNFRGGGREWMVATVLDGKGYAGFGLAQVTNTYLTRVIDWWCYDPEQDHWRQRNVLTDWFRFLPTFSFTLKGTCYVGSRMDGVWKWVEK